MKTFKGTLAAAVALLAVILFVVFVEKPVEETTDVEDRPIFTFEKQDLVKARVTRPDGSVITLVEQPAGWVIEETGFRASKSMVNRVKHQLHDLTARAAVVEDPEDAALYGLGASQRVHVELTFRDGGQEEFYGGDPNPSAVSYYIQPLPDGVIYTVKKSAVDYYVLDFDDFRERRFASFNSKDADSIDADLPNDRVLKLQRTGEKSWVMREPLEMDVALDDARSLLGRIAVLKATDFVADVTDDTDLSEWGLAEPRARITIAFGTRPPMTLLVGDRVPGDADPPLAYMLVHGDGTVYSSKDAFLDDFDKDPEEYRDRRFAQIDEDDIVTLLARIDRHETVEMQGEEVPLTKRGDVWMWWDETPVPGSTPRRLASRVASLEAQEFVDDAPSSLKPYGLDAPVASVTAADDVGQGFTLLLGDAGPSLEMDDHEVRRVYAKLDGKDPVYLVDESVFSVVEDAVREQRRKKKKEAEKAERRELMEQEMGTNEGTSP
ncbi:MAG: DUF4340 domain-containing protein [Proteobacteria bacterium]|nr:DUF4340 domain-containing protein [Pseudomonadota bacterium]MCP4918087.1 DUF4340 domain-containing protein [Pseudomonadota bacterium]